MKVIKNDHVISFIKMLASYKKSHIAAMVFSLINSALVLMQPILLMHIIDEGIMKINLRVIISYAIIYMLAVLIQNIINVAATYLYSSIGKRFIYDLRIKLLKHIQNQSGNFQTEMETGEILTVFDNDIDNIEEAASSMIFNICSDILVSVFMCAFLFYLQPDLFFIIVLLQPIMYFAQKKYNKSSNESAVKIRKILGDISKNVQEFIAHLPQFVKLNVQEYFWNKYNKDAQEYTEHSINLDLIFARSMSVANIISNMTMCLIFGYGGYKIVLGTMSMGGLISFNQYSQKLYMPLLKITQYNIKLKKTAVSINKVYGLLGHSEEIVRDRPYCDDKIIKGEIDFRNVYFSYDKKQYVYEGLNLYIVPGKFNGIVGESGTGKSTIINLLMRLWDADKGEIIVDGVNIRQYQTDALRKEISLVTQEPFLVNDSILNNIKMLDSEVCETDIIEASKRAGIYDFIVSLPEKFETRIGENGVKLSGGQKQRIAIARILIQNAPIVILDEATAALDSNLEDFIVEKFYQYLKGKTVIIISHRMSMIKNCERINVIKNRKIVEYGTHEFLISKNGEYAKLYGKI